MKTKEGVQQHMVGRRRKAVDGTRGAPTAWQEEVSSTLQKWWIARINLRPVFFALSENSLDISKHVDDPLECDRQEDLEWFKNSCL